MKLRSGLYKMMKLMVEQHSTYSSLLSTDRIVILYSWKLPKQIQYAKGKSIMNKPISEKITEFRKARSLTQEQLGTKLGISSQAVSKWEKGESMPDIMLFPQLCEIFGITADALLEVPSSVKKNSCMEQLAAYAKEVGECKAAFEAVQTCSIVSSEHKGSAQMSNDGIRINNTKGYALTISGEEMLGEIQNTDFAIIKRICELLNDENTIRVIRALEFVGFHDENEIAETIGLAPDVVRSVLFKLMKFSFCECDIDGKCTFGTQSYVLFAVLAGLYLASTEGHTGIYSISRNYPPKI